MMARMASAVRMVRRMVASLWQPTTPTVSRMASWTSAATSSISKKTYTLCELEVNAGWTSFWQVDTDGDYSTIDDRITVYPYNPNQDDDPSEDFGNRCVDIGSDTPYAIPVGGTLHFVVDNQYPGGDPRTPGYWKNWNTCTSGGQAATAAANGGWQEGFWLLERCACWRRDYSTGILWDDILNDDFEFPITECEVAVDILDQRDVGVEGEVGDGPKMASDAAYTLAIAPAGGAT